MTDLLFIDFETRSTLDLRATGVDAYAKHPTTDVWCVGWMWRGGDVEVEPPAKVAARVLQWVREGNPVVAHNASFELAIWNLICVPRFGWPVLKPEQVVDTMAMAYAMSLPGALDDAAKAVGLEVQKDAAGHRLMLQMARPRKILADGTIIWWDEPDKVARLFAYCGQDLRVTSPLYERLMPLSPAERRVWALDQRINNRGVYIDAKAADMALAVVEAEKKRLAADMYRVTGGMVSSATEVARLTKWIRDQGVQIEGLAKADVLDALSLEGLPENVRRALEIRQEAGKSSTAKIDKMLDGRSPDGRVRHILQYHAAGTGRWGGRRVQPQNLPRPTISQDDIDGVLDFMGNGATVSHVMAYMAMFCGTPMQTLASCLRGLITAAPGHELVAADFSAIEARGTAWVAGQQDVLDVFATGADIYCHEASPIFGRVITKKDKDERQVGKVAVLALGFGGGIAAFGTMARGYNLALDPIYDILAHTFTSDEIETAERTYDYYARLANGPMSKRAGITVDIIKQRWRRKNAKVKALWDDLNLAAITAVKQPGRAFTIGSVAYKAAGSFLWCRLPSGRVLCYPYPEVQETTTSWGKVVETLTYKAVDDRTKQWQRAHTYGGKLTENVVQALSRDLLVDAMTRAEDAGFPIVMHVHDEIVAELPIGSNRLGQLIDICATAPAWARGFPMAAEGWAARRYQKG